MLRPEGCSLTAQTLSTVIDAVSYVISEVSSSMHIGESFVRSGLQWLLLSSAEIYVNNLTLVTSLPAEDF
jgi:hypothetical protein